MPKFEVVSEYKPSGDQPQAIAALAEGLLVVEAGVKSGALISAQVAVELGRDVFAVPGQATNEQAKGCHKLIREGAVLTESFDDIYNHLH